MVEEICSGVVVAESAALLVERLSPYGSVEGLGEEELAEPAELARQVEMEHWGPVLLLPGRKGRSLFSLTASEAEGWPGGAERVYDEEKERRTIGSRLMQLREQLRDALIVMDIVKERLAGRAKYVVLKYLRMGIIDLEHIANEDMLAVGKLYLKVRRLREEMQSIQEASERRKEAGVSGSRDDGQGGWLKM